MANARLSEYLVKGFTMDDERLKNPPGPGHTDYFDELLERIRDIRASERRYNGGDPLPRPGERARQRTDALAAATARQPRAYRHHRTGTVAIVEVACEVGAFDGMPPSSEPWQRRGPWSATQFVGATQGRASRCCV